MRIRNCGSDSAKQILLDGRVDGGAHSNDLGVFFTAVLSYGRNGGVRENDGIQAAFGMHEHRLTGVSAMTEAADGEKTARGLVSLVHV